MLATSPTCNNYRSTFYVTHMISHTRLPLIYSVCVEKIGKPWNEAILDGQRRKGKGEGIHVPKSRYLAILMVRDGQTDSWTKVITLLLVHVHGTTPLQVHVMILYLNEYLPLWLWRTCTRVKVVILYVQLSVSMLAVTCVPTCSLYIENGVLWDSIFFRFGMYGFAEMVCSKC